MLILQKYLFREGLAASLLSLFVFVVIIVALFFAEIMGDAAQGRLPAGSVLFLLLLRLPEALHMVGPLALLSGVLLTLGRLGDESETVVMRAGGFDYRRALWPIALLSLSWAAGLLLLAGWVAPAAADRTAGLLEEAARQALLGGLQPGRFNKLDQGRLTVYVGRVDRSEGTLGDILVQFDDERYPEVLTARRGRVWVDPADGSRYLSLLDGQQVRHATQPDDGGLREIRFERNDLRLPRPSLAGMGEEVTLALPALWPADSPAQYRERHWRLAAPLAALVLGLLAVPLASRLPRQGRFGSLVIALVIYLVYSNAIHAGLVLMEQRGVQAGPGLWPLHAGLGLLMILMLARQWQRW
ncbi:MAG: LPS export ABC transporter permease LptF [Wenzhouxiangella sp.]|nr:LPS export ABC transporter permease LptF [Wenzhouxiangella sp.]TVR99000.1 MAG: LPS export ABC transporter permease LptF [Wenzhouxiangellaceae bacterium]